MTRGIAVRDLDAAGGRQLAPDMSWFRVEKHAVVTKGDPLEAHGDGVHAAPVMVEGEDRFRLSGRPVSRADHRASCGHMTSGRPWFRVDRMVPTRSYRGSGNHNFCSVEHIPHIMRAKGWHTGARLMEQWFENPASTDRDAIPVDDETIKLDWVLSFERARAAYDQAIANRIWVNEAAKREITEWLRVTGKLRDWPTRFGNFQKSWRELHKDHIQMVAVDNHYWEKVDSSLWDDLLTALGRFAFHFIVSGRVQPIQAGHNVVIEKVGIYVRDSYDFQNDKWGLDQSLGYWKMPDRAESHWFPYGCATRNSTFQNWRNQHKFGGDYYIFSNINTICTDDYFTVGHPPALSIGLPVP